MSTEQLFFARLQIELPAGQAHGAWLYGFVLFSCSQAASPLLQVPVVTNLWPWTLTSLLLCLTVDFTPGIPQ